MNLSQIIVTIALYGNIEDTPERWRSWFIYGEEAGKELGFPITHVSVYGDSFRSGKAQVIGRMRKKMITGIEKGVSLKWLTFISLPRNFKSATFDFNMSASRHYEHVSLVAPKDILAASTWNTWIEHLKLHLTFRSGAIYEVERSESADLYIALPNPRASEFKTLKVIRKF